MADPCEYLQLQCYHGASTSVVVRVEITSERDGGDRGALQLQMSCGRATCL
jgi:hypothetical protein